MIDWETRMEIDTLCSEPDSWYREQHIQKLLQEAHKAYNKDRKLIPVYQAALEHWKEAQRRYQAALEHWKEAQRRYQELKAQGYDTIPASSWPQFKSTSEIIQLKKELNELQRYAKVSKAYFHKIRRIYMEFLEFKKACRGE